jgi:lipoyl(octanoyl) transferase
LTYKIPNRGIFFQDLGLIPYKSAFEKQEFFLKQLVELKLQRYNSINPEEFASPVNYLFFCEHPHVYTLGKSGKVDNLLISEKMLQQIGAEYFETNRGGDITYHGPGQLVAYPIFDLENFFTDIHKYMRSLEEVVILTCAHFGVSTGRVSGMTGVWVNAESEIPRKICAMGVKTSRWVTMHGLALNVKPNLDYFGYIIPCGLTGKPVTSLQKEMGVEVDFEEVKEVMKNAFSAVFEAEIKNTLIPIK